MTPLPKGGFGPHLVRYVFHPPRVSVLCFSCNKKPRLIRPEALLEGSRIFREGAFFCTFPPPHIMAQKKLPSKSCLNLGTSCQFSPSGESLAHRNRSDFCAICDCDAHRGPQKSRAISEARESNACIAI